MQLLIEVGYGVVAVKGYAGCFAVAQSDGNILGIGQQEAPLRVPELLQVAQLRIIVCNCAWTRKIRRKTQGAQVMQQAHTCPLNFFRVEVIYHSSTKGRAASAAGVLHRHARVSVSGTGRKQAKGNATSASSVHIAAKGNFVEGHGVRRHSDAIVHFLCFKCG